MFLIRLETTSVLGFGLCFCWKWTGNYDNQLKQQEDRCPFYVVKMQFQKDGIGIQLSACSLIYHRIGGLMRRLDCQEHC